jgi:hypothetical protein
MKRILLTLLLSAAPAFAHDHQHEDDEDRHGRQHRDRGDGWYGEDDGEQDDSGYYSGYRDDSSQGWEDTGYSDRGPTFDDFRNDAELSWNGEWIDTPQYGTVWRPTHVGDEWQPYVNGRWVWTQAGWAWASDESFGWAVYHYGRWAWSPASGWVWLPGRVWAPAWVTWRWNDGYAAWCPLGPSVAYEQPALWVVVPTRHFLEPVRRYVVPRRARPVLPLPARSAPRTGPAIATVERAVGRPVRPLPIQDSATPGSARAGSGGVTFYRPRTSPLAIPAGNARSGSVPNAAPPATRASPPAQRPMWYGAPQATPRTQATPRPQVTPSPIQQTTNRPTGFVPKVVAPRPIVAPETAAPRASAPRAASNGEQPQAKER